MEDIYTPHDLLTLNEVMKILRLKRTAFYNIRKSGRFPKPATSVTGTARGQRWYRYQVEEYMQKIHKFI